MLRILIPFALAIPGGALAQDAVSDMSPTTELIVKGHPLPDPMGDAAYAIRVVEPVEGGIEASLKQVAGLIQFRRTDARSANATSQGATLRGLGGNASSRALVLLDGVPQSDPFGGWITWPAFAPARLSSIRVMRGGGSGGFGPGALSGAIDLTSITPSDAPVRAIGIDYGSRNAIEGNLLVGGPLGQGHGFFNLDVARGDGFVPIIQQQRGAVDRQAPYRQISLAARGVAPIGTNTELQASGLAFTDRRERGTILSENGGDGADASVRLVHAGRWQWQALAYLQLRKFSSRFVAVDAARSTILQTVDQYNVPSTGFGARFEVRPPMGRNSELRLGGDVRDVVGETHEHFTYVAGNPTRGREAGGRARTLGLFAEGAAELGRLTLTGGARVDHWQLGQGRLVERTIATGALLRNEFSPVRNGWETTGRAGLVYRIGGTKLRSAAYFGWRLPTLNELYRPFRVGIDATAANPALSPERMRGIEIGLDAAPSDALALHMTAFDNRLTSAIANVGLGAGPGVFPGVGFVAAGGVYRQRLNVDAVHSRGVELDAEVRRGDWIAGLGYAYTSARIAAKGVAAALNGLRPAQVPAHMLTAHLGWKNLNVNARYTSDQFEDDGNTRRLRDALTFDATASAPIGKQMTLKVRGENLTNVQIDAAISANGIIERATPRSIWIGLAIKY